MKCSIITPDSPTWPTQLTDLPSPPAQLWVAGDFSLLLNPMLAVIGARALTPYGSRVAADIAGDLSSKYVVTAGGAFGIDAVAHRAALGNDAVTIAVLGGGLDRLYPKANEDLFHKIVDNGGLLVSEYEPTTVVSRWQFLERNRLVAALADGVVVVEAGRKSGTLNTANWAKTLGRPIMAVPGPVISASSSGCHDLIKEGAHLVTNAEDVLAVLQGARV